MQSEIWRTMKQLASNYGEILIDPSNWRMSIGRDRNFDLQEPVTKGLKLQIWHNFNGYPRKSDSLNSERESQCRYRLVVNQLMQYIVKQKLVGRVVENPGRVGEKVVYGQ